MKKPVLAVLGLAGACAACCSIPLALTVVSGLSAAGVASWIVGSPTIALAVVAIAVFGVVAGIAFWRSRRAGASCATESSSACTCAGAR